MITALIFFISRKYSREHDDGSEDVFTIFVGLIIDMAILMLIAGSLGV